MKVVLYVAFAFGVLLGSCLFAQENQSIPVATQSLLRGVKDAGSKAIIKSVLMIECPKDGIKGTGFVLAPGRIVVTNSHVVGHCRPQELIGQSSVSSDPVRFTDAQLDGNRDLAALCTGKALPFTLKLSTDEQASVETEVETWGYPLTYNDVAPLLSRGYVAGYAARVQQPRATPVTHLIINGAFNPGNSGGPLIDRVSGRVIGVVVTKWTLWSPTIQAAIQGFRHPATSSGGTFNFQTADGRVVSFTDQEMIAMVLDEFYKNSQVMIGEAISVSELNAFLTERQSNLACHVRQ